MGPMLTGRNGMSMLSQDWSVTLGANVLFGGCVISLTNFRTFRISEYQRNCIESQRDSSTETLQALVNYEPFLLMPSNYVLTKLIGYFGFMMCESDSVKSQLNE